MNLVSEEYIDVTDEWLKNAKLNISEIKFDDYFVDDEGVRHPIKYKELVYVASCKSDEYKCALLIRSIFGGEIHMVPRIIDISNEGRKVKTPDFRWNGEKWDLKTPGQAGKFETSFERFIKKNVVEKQASNFIIDYRKIIGKFDEQIMNVVLKTLNQPSRKWVNKVIVICGKRVIAIYLKQKKSPSS